MLIEFKFKNFRTFFTLIFCFYMMLILSGCESFRRKFVREKKGPNLDAETFYTPKNYAQQPISVQEEYKEYFFFWKRCHEELINYLGVGTSYKKQIASVNRVMDNLKYMESMLKEEKAVIIEKYVNQIDVIKKQIIDSHGSFLSGEARKLSNELASIYNDLRKNYTFKNIESFIKPSNE